MGETSLTVACIPAFEEESTIAKIVINAMRHVDKVIVCDDGSRDMTATISEKLGAIVIRHESNSGKGSALRTALNHAKRFDPDIVVTLDADGQHDPEEIPKLLQPILGGEADVVNGSRFFEKSDMPTYRKIGNSLLNFLTNTRTRQKLTDTQSGFRAYSHRALESLKITEDGMGVDSQILIDMLKVGFRVVEVPVTVNYRGAKSTHNPLRHFVMVVDSIIEKVVEENPILYLGVPGFISVVAGLVAGLRVVDLFLASHVIATGTAMISITLLIVGFLLIVATIIVKTVESVTEKVKERLER